MRARKDTTSGEILLNIDDDEKGMILSGLRISLEGWADIKESTAFGPARDLARIKETTLRAMINVISSAR